MPSLSINADDNTTVISDEGTINKKGINKGTLKYAMGALSAFLNVRNIGERIFNDLKDSWYIVGIGLILATILSFLWIILMRFMAGIMVWLSIGLSAMLFGGLFGYSLYRFFVIKNEGDAESEKNIFQVNFTSGMHTSSFFKKTVFQKLQDASFRLFARRFGPSKYLAGKTKMNHHLLSK